MKAEDRYLKFVRWSDDDRAYVGYCPDLFPWGGVCHGATEESAYRTLRRLVHEEVAQLNKGRKALPPPSTRPMRDAVLA
jgi:hypothetical protein